ncbi:MAG: PAS domain S-box protein [Planctomycetes bacterium]|nr:PAS domain S-box protein [Planctomycetota bacterium]
MNLILFLSITLRLIAAFMSIRIALRFRDYRILLLAAILILTSVRQVFHYAGEPANVWLSEQSWGTSLEELPSVLASLLAIPCVFYLGRILEDQRRSLLAVERGERRLRSCIETSPNIAMQWYDESGKVIFWNHASERVFGWSTSEATGKQLCDLFLNSSQHAEFLEALASIKATGKSVGPTEFQFERRDGVACQCLSTIFSIPGESGQVIYVCMDVDVTERIQAQNELQLRETQLQLFVEHTPAAVAMLDRDMKYIIASKRWMQDYRLSDASIVGRSHYDVFKDLPDRWRHVHERCLAGSVESCAEDIFPREDGAIDWVRWETLPWFHNSGEIGGIIMFTEVITERVQAREALRQSEERFRVLVESMDVVAWEADPATTQFTFVTGQPERVTGFKPEEWYAPDFWVNHIHPDDREGSVEFCRNATLRGIPHDFEYRFVKKDGQDAWLHDFVAVEIRDGKAVKLRGLMLDVTESKESQARLAKSEERLRATIEAVRLGFWELNIETQDLQLSPEWYQLLGYKFGDFPSTTEAAHSFFHPDDRDAIVAHFDKFVANPEKPFEMEFRMKHRDGQYRWWMSRGYAVKLKDGRGLLVRGINLDITDQKHISTALQESEERFKGIADHGSVGIWQVGLDQRSIYANRAMCDLLEVDSEEELKGIHVSSFCKPDEWMQINQEFGRRNNGVASTYEIDLIGRRGTKKRVLISGAPLRTSEGAVRGSIATFTDISALKQAEQSAQESRERFAGIVQSAMDGIISIDDSHRIVLFNKAAETMFGVGQSEVHGQSIERLIPDRFRSSHAEHIRVFQKTGTTNRKMGSLGTVSGIRANGEEFQIEASISQMDVAGEHFFTVILRDISERLRQESELQESREMLERAQEVGRIGSWWWVPSAGDQLNWTKETYRIFGLSEDEFDRRMESLMDYFHPDDREFVRAELDAAIRGERRFNIDHRIVRRNGDVGWVHAEADIVRDNAGLPLKMIGVCQEITESKQAEHLEQIRTFMLEGLTAGKPLEGILDGVARQIDKARPGMLCSILLLDETGRRLKHGAAPSLPDFYNVAIDGVEIGEKVGSCGATAFAGRPTIVADVMTHENWAPYRDLANRAGVACCWSFPITSAGEKVLGTFAVYRRDPGLPSPDDVELIETAAHFVSVAVEGKRADEAVIAARQALLDQQRQETQRVEAELEKLRDELVLKTRLATIGQVSASIAHELRNPLGAVRNAAYFLKRRAGVHDEKLTQYLSIIEHEVETSDRIISNLMEMTRAKLPEKQLVNLGEILQSIIASTPVPEYVTIRRTMQPDPFTLNADPSQLRQVVSNLFTNAVQSMRHSGEIRIDAHRTDDYDVILFSDDGEGVSPIDRGRLFEPLFTTKAKGTGLGLTICRQIIERHGGSIDLIENSPRGAVFRIRLPRALDVTQGESA